MDKKRSKGVTIFAWLIITGAILGILSLQYSRQFNPSISFYFYIILYPFSIITAIYLLKLKKIARIVIIVISVLVALESVATTPYFIKSNQPYFDKLIEEGYNQGMENAKIKYNDKIVTEAMKAVEELKMKDAIKAMGTILIIFIIFISVSFNCCVIYFFTRPKIKEQFK